MNSTKQRTYIIGDEWVYFKIYAGPQILESILINEIYEIYHKLIKYRYVDKFFFIRYRDPEYHLRIRFHITNTKNILIVIELLNKKLKSYVNKKIIWKLCVESYTRELERYGYDKIDEIETLFHLESLMIVDFIKNTTDYKSDSIRWLWGIKFIDSILDRLDFLLDDKIYYVSIMKNSYASEFKMNKSMKIQLDNEYRIYKNQIEQIFSDKNQTITEWTFLISQYIATSEPIIGSIFQAAKNRSHIANILDLTGSLIHMFINRLFRTNQRKYEFVIYYYMNKYYNAYKARVKYNKESIPLTRAGAKLFRTDFQNKSKQ